MSDESLSVGAVELATELTIAWLGNPNTRASAEEVPAFLNKMHDAVQSLSSGGSSPESEATPVAQRYEPATTVRKSLSSRDHIISMIDGKPYKTLRRHLSGHGLTPAEYRERYNLKSDYPMVAPSYSEHRRTLANQIGLGRKTRKASSKSAEGSSARPSRARKPKQTTPAE